MTTHQDDPAHVQAVVDAAIAAMKGQGSYIAIDRASLALLEARKPKLKTCEPPKEFWDKDYHWLCYRAGESVPARWHRNNLRWSLSNGVYVSNVEAVEYGYTYHTVALPPVEYTKAEILAIWKKIDEDIDGLHDAVVATVRAVQAGEKP